MKPPHAIPDIGLCTKGRTLRNRLGAINFRLARGNYGFGWNIYQTSHLDSLGDLIASVTTLSEVQSITETVEGQILARLDDAPR